MLIWAVRRSESISWILRTGSWAAPHTHQLRGPILLVQLQCNAILIAEGIRSVVEAALIDERPIQKLRACVVCVSIIVELISDGES